MVFFNKALKKHPKKMVQFYKDFFKKYKLGEKLGELKLKDPHMIVGFQLRRMAEQNDIKVMKVFSTVLIQWGNEYFVKSILPGKFKKLLKILSLKLTSLIYI